MPDPTAGKVLRPYDGYDVLGKWSSQSFDQVTREVLERRLHAIPPRRFFDPAVFAVLEAVCARLLATAVGSPPIANSIDADLYDGRGEGYRHTDMPSAAHTWCKGILGIDRTAARRFAKPFCELSGEDQDIVLGAVQNGDVEQADFDGLPVARFFADVLLKEAAGYFYSLPPAWNEIGFGGPASPRGYVRLGLDRRDPWEAPLARGSVP